MQISQEAAKAVWYSHLFKDFPQFIVIHTAKGFGVVNKAEVDVSLGLSCFFDDPTDVGNLISGSSVFSKSSLNIWNFMVHILLKFMVHILACRILSIILLGKGEKERYTHLNAEFQKNIYFCCIDYAKAFDCVKHNKLWKILKDMGIPDHLTCLLRNLYAGQEATVRTRHGKIDWFQIGKGVRQGCIFSPCLFNLYAEYIMHAKCGAG